eukprot:5161114-Amphidinium_carterae.1
MECLLKDVTLEANEPYYRDGHMHYYVTDLPDGPAKENGTFSKQLLQEFKQLSMQSLSVSAFDCKSAVSLSIGCKLDCELEHEPTAKTFVLWPCNSIAPKAAIWLKCGLRADIECFAQ